jgi:protein gp37
MTMPTGISYVTEVWNPVIGCTKVSAGCSNCWAEAMAKRLQAMKAPGYEDIVDGDGHWHQGSVSLQSQATIDKPLHWRRKRRILVCAMGDLFHESVPADWHEEIFRVMESKQGRRHQYLLLTKRPERMRDVLKQFFGRVPYNWWCGTSVENQWAADRRIPALLEVPAYHHWVSVEPMLGELSLEPWLSRSSYWPEPIPASWDTMPWPEWVPQEVRDQISDFWCPEWGRSPAQWIASAHENHAPRFGEVVTLRSLLGEGMEEGRFVYAWGNLARLVRDDGSFGYAVLNATPFRKPGIDWVVCGAESGPNRRHFATRWASRLLSQCRAARVPFYGKQAGALEPCCPLLLDQGHLVHELPKEWRSFR